MNIIYIVRAGNAYEETEIVGVFNDRATAERCRRENDHRFDGAYITAWDMTANHEVK